ncbi:MAG TPA: hypothetical protein VN721_10520 [Flavipsychrobacter sp.]|nr:hypothetical protein [Flavipsychrobacter sp.]
MKNVILFVAACMIMLMLASTGFYGDWFHNKVLNTFDDFSSQTDSMDISYRERIRWDGGYSFATGVTKYFADNKIKNPLLLLPSDKYMKANKSNIRVPEPIIFYYFTGYQSVQYTDSNAKKANYTVLIRNNKFALVPINTPQERDGIINLFKHG